MENLDRRLLLAGLGLVGAAAAASASAGTLNPPPGPVAATGKTTNEIEPRVAVQSLPGDANNSFIISQPGSYYLMGNINGAGGKNGISIQADGVTLDLNGFALIGEATGSAVGITVPAPRTGLCVRNGTIRQWRSFGVAAQNASSSVLERLRAFLNNEDGLRIGNESVVRDCVMTGNSGNGLLSSDRVLVSGCVVDVNGGTSGMSLGSDVQVIDCLVSRSLGVADGIQVGARSTVLRCTVSRNAGNGIQVGAGTTVADCTVCWNGANGIVGSDRCHIARNTCDANLSIGINVNGSGSRVDGNICTNGGGGIYVNAPNNLVVRNSAGGNTAGDFGILPGNKVGVASIQNVTADALFLLDQPWSNFIF
jgi:hypothetical protein